MPNHTTVKILLSLSVDDGSNQTLRGLPGMFKPEFGKLSHSL